MKRIVFAVFAIVAAATAISAQADKIDICHAIGGPNNFVRISVSVNALEAHQAHGDTIAITVCGILGDPSAQ